VNAPDADTEEAGIEFMIIPSMNLRKVVRESQITMGKSRLEKKTVFNISPKCLRLSQIFSGIL
jgi:hypothetical protein